jgi:2-oxoglutarate ferredoxin oxidoreductase subunit gamma
MNNSRQSASGPAEVQDPGVERTIMAGFGGQGIMLAGKIAIQAGMILGLRVTYIPSYGAEVRGGTAHCHVTISRQEIASPVIARPDFCLVMNSPSLTKFSPQLRKGGTLITNSSMVDESSGRSDITEVRIPANRIAEERGTIKAANMAILGAFIRHSKLLSLESVCRVLPDALPSRHQDLLEINLNALKDGYEQA